MSLPLRTRPAIAAATAGALALGGAFLASPATAADTAPVSAGRPVQDQPIRVATFNLSLNRNTQGELVEDLSTGDDVQARTVAEIIQRADPDVILLNEFDYVEGGAAVDLFRDNYLEVSQHGADPIEFPYAFVAPSNTGVPSGFDLNNNGVVSGGDDALGFGLFPGQYGMVVLSKLPIRTDEVRTFQHFLWKDMPGALLPDDPATAAPADWYSPEELDVFRLSSKSHWDVPVQVGGQTVHILADHPTPPTFDGPEDRNGRRNHDEIRFWADYITPGKGRYIYDDEGGRGGLSPAESFVIVGDHNADPLDGDSVDAAIDQLLDNRRITDPLPTSEGGPEASVLQGGANLTHRGDPAYDTADFADTAPGNLRADYVLPSRKLSVVDAGVFWPASADPLSALTGTFPFPSSDHRLVWVDLQVPRVGH
ncbi:endonuclease/exonuclease/phosphatase family protein [Microbacterium sp. 4R-513]|uniref:endonuclease/exonuclease/phosphatase family protein n=1 Tax=Microbacterium sp. 4R-513 TaxID=2567934 RepID=UPI0013E117A7|nr:endonuclease/exonuclease/phosphatase family protein [Microbacterium sp. 4R-513]QIG40131.1 endonuclease/exonuclease/phosphatase family protein [Microbacterium sp. 4R-513]